VIRRIAALSAIVAVGSGCAGGQPLLHPARTLKTGDLRMAGGVSANVIAGSFADDLRNAREQASRDPSGATTPGAPGTNPEYAKGAIASAMGAPGIAPFVAARVGVGSQFEGGLGYTGRSVRADMRRSFDGDNWSLSLGVGAMAALYARDQSTDLPNVSLDKLHGYGIDLPILGGWQSNGGLYMFWFGARAGFERDVIEAVSSEPNHVPAESQPFRLDATRWYGGPVLGAATGFHHVHVAVELDAGYNVIRGDYNQTTVTASGFMITPATALWWTLD